MNTSVNQMDDQSYFENFSSNLQNQRLADELEEILALAEEFELYNNQESEWDL